MNTVDPAIIEYVEREIIPRYDVFDKAHRRDHVCMVIEQSLVLAQYMPDLIIRCCCFLSNISFGGVAGRLSDRVVSESRQSH